MRKVKGAGSDTIFGRSHIVILWTLGSGDPYDYNQEIVKFEIFEGAILDCNIMALDFSR